MPSVNDMVVSEVLVKDSASAVLDRVNAAMQRVAASEASMQEGADVVDKKVASSTRQLEGYARGFENLRRSVDPVYDSQTRVANTALKLQQYVAAGVATEAEAGSVLQAFRAGLEDVATAHGHVTGASYKMREGLVLVHEFLRGDWKRAVGSATIELQNFGLMGFIFNPIVLGAVAMGAAVVAAVVRMVEAEATVKEFDRTIKATGETAVLSGQEVKQFADALSRTGPFSQSDLEAAAGALLKYRGVATDLFTTVLPLAEDFAAVAGQKLPQAADELAKTFEGGFASIERLNEQFPFLTRQQLLYLQQLDRNHQLSEEARIAADALAKSLSGMAANSVSPLSEAFKKLSNGWHDFLDAINDPSSLISLEGTLTDIENIANGIASAWSFLKSIGPSGGPVAIPGHAGDLRNGPTPFRFIGGPSGVADSSKFAMGFDTGGAPAPVSPATLSGGSLTAQATQKAVLQLTKSLDDQARQLQMTSDAFGRTDAESLRLKLTTEAGALATDKDVAARINQVVAIQQGIDAKKLDAEANQRALAASIAQSQQEEKARLDAAKAVKEMLQQRDSVSSNIKQEVENRARLIDALKKGNLEYQTEVEYQRILNDYRRTGLPLVGAEKDAAYQTARGMAEQDLQLQAMRNDGTGLASVIRGVGGSLESAFDSGIQGGKKFITVLDDVGSQLAKLIEQAFIFKPLEDSLDKLAGGPGVKGGAGGLLGAAGTAIGGSAFGSLFGGESSGVNLFGQATDTAFGGVLGVGGTSFADAVAAGVIPAMAGGGSFDGGTPILVGEQGPELMVPRAAGTVIPNGALGGGSPVFNIQVDARGSSDPAAVEAAVHRGIAQAAPAIVQASIAATTAARHRNPTIFAPTQR